MGLDMYLEREHYIGGQYDFVGAKGIINITFENSYSQRKEFKINARKISSINESVGSWRKANQVHNFFVQKAQGGRDECQRTYVPNDLLIELRNTCKRILDARNAWGMEHEKTLNLITELLPPSAGFFFGSTGIDEYYFQDLENTIDILKDVEANKGDYYYESSW